MRRLIKAQRRSAGASSPERRSDFPWSAGSAVAMLLGLLTPWPSPHIDRYMPLVAVALGAFDQDADGGFWLLCSALWVACAVLWFGLVALVWVLWRRWST